MTRLRVLPTVALSFLCIPDALPAQEQEAQPVVTEGSRVRVTSPPLEHRLRGELVSLTGGYLVVLPDGRDVNETKLPWNQVTALDVSTGRRSNWLKGGLIGAGVSGALGLGLAAVACGQVECTGGEIPAFTAVSVGVGFAVGAGIGALSKRDRWEEVDLSTLEPVVSLLPERNHSPAIRIGLRLRI